MFYTAIIMPYAMAFMDGINNNIRKKHHDYSRGGHRPVPVLLRYYFIIIDMVMCIFSAYEDENGNLVYKPQDVILNYLQGWFLFDLLASIPFE